MPQRDFPIGNPGFGKSHAIERLLRAPSTISIMRHVERRAAIHCALASG